jgi:hypothetical protein
MGMVLSRLRGGKLFGSDGGGRETRAFLFLQ